MHTYMHAHTEILQSMASTQYCALVEHIYHCQVPSAHNNYYIIMCFAASVNICGDLLSKALNMSSAVEWTFYAQETPA